MRSGQARCSACRSKDILARSRSSATRKLPPFSHETRPKKHARSAMRPLSYLFPHRGLHHGCLYEVTKWVACICFVLCSPLCTATDAAPSKTKVYALSTWKNITCRAKGRFQDRDYCASAVMDQIVADGKSAIPI